MNPAKDMDPQTLTFLTTLSGAAVGGGLAILGSYFNNRAAAQRYDVQLRNEKEQREQALLRQLGEELHAATAAWMKRVDLRYMHFYSMMVGNISYDQAQAMEVDQSKTVHDVARIELLIDVYFPQIRKCYDLYAAHRDAVEEVRLEFKKTYPNGNVVKDAQFLEKFEAAGKLMQDASAVLRLAIVGALRRPELPKWTYSDKSYT